MCCTRSRFPWCSIMILWWRAHATSGICLTAPSRKTPEGVAELYLQERGELLKRIDGYLENRKIECGIVIPTCLRTPVLILEPRECMRRYHDPEQEGAFPTQFPIKGFGFVQPRNDLRRSIIPPNFRELPARVAAAMTTLIREDVLAADATDTEYHSTLRGLLPLLSSSQVTSTTTPRRDRRPSEGATALTLRTLAAWMTLAWRRPSAT